MRIGVIGNCEKHDLTITIAVLLQAYKGIPASVVADNTRQYQYFDGDASGVSIHTSNHESSGITIYDCHSDTMFAEPFDKVILATNYERPSLEFAKQAAARFAADALVAITEDCSISEKYIQVQFRNIARKYEYEDSPKRRIDWVHDGRIQTRKVSSDFAEAVNELMKDLFDVPLKDSKKLWRMVSKKGGV